jgi:hypothetical protein
MNKKFNIQYTYPSRFIPLTPPGTVDKAICGLEQYILTKKKGLSPEGVVEASKMPTPMRPSRLTKIIWLLGILQT